MRLWSYREAGEAIARLSPKGSIYGVSLLDARLGDKNINEMSFMGSMHNKDPLTIEVRVNDLVIHSNGILPGSISRWVAAARGSIYVKRFDAFELKVTPNWCDLDVQLTYDTPESESSFSQNLKFYAGTWMASGAMAFNLVDMKLLDP